MDIKQLLPVLLKGKLGEREQALLNILESGDPSAVMPVLMQALEQNKTPRMDVYAALKRIIPAETLGAIIKYFESTKNI